MHESATESLPMNTSSGLHGSFGKSSTPWVGQRFLGDFLEDWIGAYHDVEIGVEDALDLGSGVGFVIAHLDGRSTGKQRSHAGALRSRLHMGRRRDLADDVVCRYP